MEKEFLVIQTVMQFIGQHGSLGYEKGKVYVLNVFHYANYGVTISRKDGSGTCTYSSMENFFKNWRNI